MCLLRTQDTRRLAGSSAKLEATDAAQAAYALSIPTFVISVGNQVGQAHLQDMANAGSGKAIGGSDNAIFYQALNPSQLVGAFNDIITGVRSCLLTVEGQLDPANVQGTVILDGITLLQGSDWQVKDAHTLELLGATCDRYLAGGNHDIKASFACGSIID